jgi:hypothetical protein
MKTIVFVGRAGALNDPNIGELFRWVTRQMSGMRSFLLVRNEECTMAQQQRLPSHGIVGLL